MVVSGYIPINIKVNETGLVQSRQEFLLPSDAYPTLENAYIWRERIKRKQGLQLLGRLRRVFTAQSLGNTDFFGAIIENLVTKFSLDVTAQIEPGSVVAVAGATTWIDDGSGNMQIVGVNHGLINYSTGFISLNAGPGITAVTVSFNYFPCLPVMGLRLKEETNTNNEKTIAFDTVYAYEFVGSAWQEYITGLGNATWTGTDYQFFWSTNYWTADNNAKVFWVTNNNDPIRYTDGTAWIDFSPQINSGGDLLINALCLLPFRGRLVAFNTTESGGVFRNRIRWAAIGTPFTIASAIVTTVSPNAWRDDIRGKGGFLNIPTNEDIISVGFVRDNLVIYCERSTWQLRYTGRSIAPFQIEKVNSELGAESTFSAVQFDTSLVGVGDKGIVECDSFKSERIDIKIPDLVFQFNNQNNGTRRVHGIRDYTQRLAYWIYPFTDNNGTFPDRRLVYNYENDSWAIFTDSLTALGTFQPQDTRTWANTIIPWKECNFIWTNKPSLIPAVIGGNQQGFVLYVGGGVESGQTTNDESLYIDNIAGNGILPTSNPIVITSPNHNLQTGQIIQIVNLPVGSLYYPYINDEIYQVNVLSTDDFYLTVYSNGQYNEPGLAPALAYTGGGEIKVRDNFSITSKKFNYMDEGKQIQMGYLDILMDTTDAGAIAINIYTDYNNDTPINITPQDVTEDTFFNNVIPTYPEGISIVGGNKNWHRVVCPTNANFITIEYTLNNEQMQNQCQESDVQIDAQIIYQRPGGRQGITQ